jgi:ppGpp synthetase/RelA/SpoT-type nucleotidyltranferase
MGLNFEIQVKTLLDFAWQEIEHDRAYKTSAQFPKKIPSLEAFQGWISLSL